MNIATAYVTILPDNSKFRSEVVSGAKSASEEASRKATVTPTVNTAPAKKAFADLGQTATKTGQQLATTFARLFGAGLIGAGIKKSIDAASNLNETVTKTRIIFGDMASEIEASAETAARAMGMSKRAYMDATSSLKGLLDNMGLAADMSVKWSQDLTQLGSDLASFFNTDPADAIYAITAALRGESEPIRRYNVQLNEMNLKQKALELQLYSGKGALDSNAKAQAALALIMEQTSTAQGDFARTADGAANSQRIAAAVAEDSAASFGQSLLPVYTRIIQVVTTMSEVFAKLPAPVQLAVVALAALAVLSGPIGGLTDMMKGLGKAIQEAGAKSIGMTAALAGLIAVGLLVYSIFKKLGDQETEAEVQSKKLTEALMSTATTLNMTELAAATAADAVGLFSDELYAAAEQMERDFLAKTPYLLDAMLAAGISMDSMTEAAHDQRAALALLGKVTDVAAAKGWKFDLSMDSLMKSTEFMATGPASDLEQALFMLAKHLNTAAGASKLTKDELIKLAQAGDVTAIAALKASGMLDEAFRHLGPDGVAAAEALLRAAGGADVAGKSAEELAAATEAEAAAAARSAVATQSLNDALSETRTEMDLASDAADSLKDAMDRVMGNTMDLTEANDAMQQGYIDLAAQFNATDENGNLLSNTLDGFTARGLENRAAVNDQVDAIKDMGAAMVATGSSTEDAADAMILQRENLIQNLEAFGLTREAAEAYLEQLGFTPENITTAVELDNVEARKAELKGILDQLGDIDEGAAAEIEALIDEGDFASADARLRALAADRQIWMNVNVRGGGFIDIVPLSKSRTQVRVAAAGLIADKPTYAMFGEAGIEAVLPLTRPSELRAILSDPRVSGPVADAMGGEASMSTAGGVATSSTSATRQMYAGDTYYLFGYSEDMMRQLEARLDARKRGRR